MTNPSESLGRVRDAILRMWEHRYDVRADDLSVPPEAAEHFPGPVVVDLGQLAVAHSEILALTGTSEPLPPEADSPDSPVVNLDAFRIRHENEFEDEQVAYIEALWGRETFAFNAAVRDLEAMRRGTEAPGKPLRPPETYHEAAHLILHVRALANDMARHFEMPEMVRPEDDLAVQKKPDPTVG